MTSQLNSSARGSKGPISCVCTEFCVCCQAVSPVDGGCLGRVPVPAPPLYAMMAMRWRMWWRGGSTKISPGCCGSQPRTLANCPRPNRTREDDGRSTSDTSTADTTTKRRQMHNMRRNAYPNSGLAPSQAPPKALGRLEWLDLVRYVGTLPSQRGNVVPSCLRSRKCPVNLGKTSPINS